MSSTTSRSPPTEIPLRRRCVRFSGWSWGGSGTGAPWGLGRRTPGVIRVVQVCPWTGCSGWFSVCGCFTWNTSASVPASVSGLPLRQFRLCVCVSSASVLRQLLRCMGCWSVVRLRYGSPPRDPLPDRPVDLPSGAAPEVHAGVLPVDRAGDRWPLSSARSCHTPCASLDRPLSEPSEPSSRRAVEPSKNLRSDDAGGVRTIAGRRDDRTACVGVGVGVGVGRRGGARRGRVLVGALVGRLRIGRVGATAAHAG